MKEYTRYCHNVDREIIFYIIDKNENIIFELSDSSCTHGDGVLDDIVFRDIPCSGRFDPQEKTLIASFAGVKNNKIKIMVEKLLDKFSPIKTYIWADNLDGVSLSQFYEKLDKEIFE